MSGDDEELIAVLNSKGPACLVTVETALGSTPREAGTWMLVTPNQSFRTIGGGELEFMAIDHARALLNSGKASDLMDVPLGPEIGQCCGGRVTVSLSSLNLPLRRELLDRLDEEQNSLPQVYVFGAGHVGKALIRMLLLLPVRALLVDTREAELNAAMAGTETLLTAIPEEVVRNAPVGSAFVVMTHNHSLDFLIVQEALSRGDAAYVGMIGSATKRATFDRWIAREGGSADGLICPIGGDDHRDKRPAVIAAQVAAELMRCLGGEHVSNLQSFR